MAAPKFRHHLSNVTPFKQMLKKTPLGRLLMADIASGAVFPAIRNERMDFYHGGGKILSFDGNRFTTHRKYVRGLDLKKDKGSGPKEPDYVAEADLVKAHETAMKKNKIPDFRDQYASIKELCRLYSGAEREGLSSLHAKFSPHSGGNLVVLDIETTFSNDLSNSIDDGDRMAANRYSIDLLLYDNRRGVLQFVEGKLFANSAIHPGKTTPPKVLGQLTDYECEIKSRTSEILQEYACYVDNVNDLFGLSLTVPKAVSEKVVLLIFGFDQDQRDNRLKNNVTANPCYKGISRYAKGNVKGIKSLKPLFA